jgi:hypothetical protein
MSVGLALWSTQDMSDKRAFDRHCIWFPVSVETGARQVWAVCRDIGAGGIMISSAGALEIGAAVTVTFRIAPNDPAERKVEGRIVRIEPNQDDRDGTWPHRLAIEFLQPIPELDSLLENWTLPPSSGRA